MNVLDIPYGTFGLQRSMWLQLAHEKLDRAVFAAYGWEWRSPNGGLEEEEVLGRLLEENLRRSA